MREFSTSCNKLNGRTIPRVPVDKRPWIIVWFVTLTILVMSAAVLLFHHHLDLRSTSESPSLAGRDTDTSDSVVGERDNVVSGAVSMTTKTLKTYVPLHVKQKNRKFYSLPGRRRINRGTLTSKRNGRRGSRISTTEASTTSTTSPKVSRNPPPKTTSDEVSAKTAAVRAIAVTRAAVTSTTNTQRLDVATGSSRPHTDVRTNDQSTSRTFLRSEVNDTTTRKVVSSPELAEIPRTTTFRPAFSISSDIDSPDLTHLNTSDHSFEINSTTRIKQNLYMATGVESDLTERRAKAIATNFSLSLTVRNLSVPPSSNSEVATDVDFSKRVSEHETIPMTEVDDRQEVTSSALLRESELISTAEARLTTLVDFESLLGLDIEKGSVDEVLGKTSDNVNGRSSSLHHPWKEIHDDVPMFESSNLYPSPTDHTTSSNQRSEENVQNSFAGSSDNGRLPRESPLGSSPDASSIRESMPDVPSSPWPSGEKGRGDASIEKLTRLAKWPLRTSLGVGSTGFDVRHVVKNVDVQDEKKNRSEESNKFTDFYPATEKTSSEVATAGDSNNATRQLTFEREKSATAVPKKYSAKIALEFTTSPDRLSHYFTLKTSHVSGAPENWSSTVRPISTLEPTASTRQRVSTAPKITSNSMVCVYRRTHANWQSGKMLFNLETFPYENCNLLVYCCVGLNVHFDIDAHAYEADVKLLKKAKISHPGLQTFVMIGGGNQQSTVLWTIIGNRFHEEMFVQATVTWLLERSFDGVYIYWTSPAPKDKADLLRTTGFLFRFLRKSHLLFGIILPSNEESLRGFDVPGLTRLLNDVPAGILLAPSDQRKGEYNITHYERADDLLKRLARLEDVSNISSTICPMLPFAGSSFKLHAVLHDGDVVLKPVARGNPGLVSGEAGKLAYFEVCQQLKEGDHFVFSTRESVMVREGYITFLTPRALANLLGNAILRRPFRCLGAWEPEWDDFGGVCDSGKHPLLRTLHTFVA